MKRQVIDFLKCLTCVGAMGMASFCCARKDKATEVAEILSSEFAQQVPLGAPEVSVVTFLDRHRISHRFAPHLRAIKGLIPDIDPKSYLKPGVELEFRFDHYGRLTKYYIRPVYTWL
jgi:hypothetical protein